ncbi:MAG: ABC transporter ATP-binding protein [Propionibacteriaceae bacterium]|jgi:ABC-type lipoprotein export system ATPase subunit|nr:ABC transporter ATP-binding protein [Propionibacteriaceae bacterium]
MSALVEARGIVVDYPLAVGTVHALRGVDLTLIAGEAVCLFGASGSGKSTLLNVLAGLEAPDAGSLRVCGKDTLALSEEQRTALRLRSIGMVFQENNLVAQFTAGENVELILRCQGSSAPKRTAIELLGSLGVAELADRLPIDMSGGQRQRVGIARALAGDRAVILCDEPTGALDRTNSDVLFGLLRDLAHSKGIAVLIATHDRDAEKYADRVLEISDGELVTT